MKNQLFDYMAVKWFINHVIRNNRTNIPISFGGSDGLLEQSYLSKKSAISKTELRR